MDTAPPTSAHPPTRFLCFLSTAVFIKKQEVCLYGFIVHVLWTKAPGSLRINISLSVNGGVKPRRTHSETHRRLGGPWVADDRVGPLVIKPVVSWEH